MLRDGRLTTYVAFKGDDSKYVNEAFLSVYTKPRIFSKVHTTHHHLNFESERYAPVSVVCQLNKVILAIIFLKWEFSFSQEKKTHECLTPALRFKGAYVFKSLENYPERPFKLRVLFFSA